MLVSSLIQQMVGHLNPRAFVNYSQTSYRTAHYLSSCSDLVTAVSLYQIILCSVLPAQIMLSQHMHVVLNELGLPSVLTCLCSCLTCSDNAFLLMPNKKMLFTFTGDSALDPGTFWNELQVKSIRDTYV